MHSWVGYCWNPKTFNMVKKYLRNGTCDCCGSYGNHNIDINGIVSQEGGIELLKELGIGTSELFDYKSVWRNPHAKELYQKYPDKIDYKEASHNPKLFHMIHPSLSTALKIATPVAEQIRKDVKNGKETYEGTDLIADLKKAFIKNLH
jgi:hypothetical protein